MINTALSRLNDSLGRTDTVEKFLDACRTAEKQDNGKHPRQFKLLILRLRDARSKLSATRSPVERRGGTSAVASGLARSTYRTNGPDGPRAVQVAARQARPDSSARRKFLEEEAIPEWDAIIGDVSTGLDSFVLNAYVHKGQDCLDLGQIYQKENRIDKAIEFYGKAGRAFQEGLTRLSQAAPENDPDPKRDYALRLLKGELALARQQATLLPSTSSTPDPSRIPEELRLTRERLNAVQSQLQGKVEQLNAIEQRLKTVTQELTLEKSKRTELDATIAGLNAKLGATIAEFNGRLDATKAELNGKLATTQAALADYQKKYDELASKGPGILAEQVKSAIAERDEARKKVYEDAFLAYAIGTQRFSIRDFDGAVRNLSQAINWYPRDARFYYLRGIALYLDSRNGATVSLADAAEDIRRGARLERADSSAFDEVGHTLSRMQGDVIEWVESHRHPIVSAR